MGCWWEFGWPIDGSLSWRKSVMNAYECGISMGKRVVINGWHVNWNSYLPFYLTCCLKFLSATLSSMLFEIYICHSTWHIIWNFCLSFYLTCLLKLLYPPFSDMLIEISICYSIWHVFEFSICHSIRNSVWHSFWHLIFLGTYILTFSPAIYLTRVVTFYLTCCLKFLSAVLSDMFFEISICHSISHVLFWNFCLLLYLTCCLKFLSASLSDMLFLLLYLTCNFKFHLQLYVTCFASNSLSAILPDRFIEISICHFT